MEKYIKHMISLGLIFIMVLAGCSSKEEDIQASKEEVEKFGEITNLINDGNFEETETKLKALYEDCSYSDEEGINKMIQYKLFYEKQNMQDEALAVVVDYIRANKNKIGNFENSNHEEHFRYAVRTLNNMLENVAEDKKEEIINDIGKDTLTEYNEQYLYPPFEMEAEAKPQRYLEY